MKVSDDRSTGERSFGGVEGDGVDGAGLEVGQLVLLPIAFHEDGVSCDWGTDTGLNTTTLPNKVFFFSSAE